MVRISNVRFQTESSKTEQNLFQTEQNRFPTSLEPILYLKIRRQTGLEPV